MKPEKIIIGIILVIVGLVLLYWGYQKLQPDEIEKSINTVNELYKNLSGSEIPAPYKKDNSAAIIILILGSISFLCGLFIINQSRK